MPHIHTEPGQHDHTVSMYVFRTDFSEPRLMLHLHIKMKAYAQFGGHIELDETPWQAVIREIQEETGYGTNQLHVLQPTQRMKHIAGATVHPQSVVYATMGYPSIGSHNHIDSVYVFTTNEAPLHAPGAGESTDIRHFTREGLVKAECVDSITHDIALYCFDEIIGNWQPVSCSDFS